MQTLMDVVDVRAIAPTTLRLTFSDGLAASVDLRDRLAWTGIFAELLDNPELFAAVSVDQERGVVTWPGGADLDSDQLHAWARGRAAPEWATAGE
jgi:hypothetical protein